MTTDPPRQVLRVAGWAAFVGAVALGVLLLTEPGNHELLGRRIALASVGAGLVLARWAVRRARAVLSVGVVAWAGLVLGMTLGSDLPRVASGRPNTWSLYHYVIGSKYFAELGYTGLYVQTLASDAERAEPELHPMQIRDLATYERVPPSEVDVARSDAWTDERWSEFGADLEYFGPRLPWDDVLRDRGYNATPTGNAVYRQLTRLPVGTPAMTFLGLLDPLLLAGAFLAVARVFGPGRALVAAGWLLLFPGNEHRVAGMPLQYDYLAALLLMACAWRRGWVAVAGGLLAYAAMVRAFPGLLAAGMVVWAAGRWWGGGGLDRRVVRFLGALALGCVVLAAAGSLSRRGPGAWAEWSTNIRTHARTHRLGERRVGLQHLFTYQAGEDWPNESGRRLGWEARWPRWLVAALVGGLLWLAGGLRGGARGDDPLEHLALALWLVFSWVVVSRYYASALCLLLILGPGEDAESDSEPVAAGLLGCIALYYLYALQEDDRYAQWLLSNGLMLVGWITLLAVRLGRGTPQSRTLTTSV